MTVSLLLAGTQDTGGTGIDTLRSIENLLRRSGALWLDRLCGGALLSLAGALAFYRRAGT